MELYILDNNDLTTLSILECSSYEINLDNQFTDKSVFRVNKAAGQIKDNFLVVNGLYQQFLFIIDEVEATDKEEKFVNLVCSDISNIFNRKIIQQDIDLMTTRSIEYFLAHTIDVNFINSDDSFLNKSYIEVTYTEHTQAKEATNAENGIYNFHTFMENCREHHNVFVDFKFEDGKLKITIAYKNDSAVIIDTTLPEVTHYNKVYEQDITAKVQVYIRENDTIKNYYLKTDRTITTNKNDPDRAAGAIEVISVETEDDALQEATNVFKGNTYKHLVEFSMSKNSKLVDTTTLYICRAIRIKTPDGIYDSIISGISLDDDNYINYKSGNIRINFIDKLKQEKENYGDKLDVAGGVIKGNLTTGKTDGSTTFQIYGGSSSNIYWKEYGYGDKFRINPEFGGTDDSNKLKIQGAVGGAGEDPSLYDLMTISGKNGNLDLKGSAIIRGTLNGAGSTKILGTAGDKPLMVRGIVGCDANGSAVGELHLGYGSDYETKFGKTAQTVIDANGTIKIPTDGTQGRGITNSAGKSIIRDWSNTNTTVDATGGVLYLGYQNTTGLNIINGKSTIDSNGNFATAGEVKATNGFWSRDQGTVGTASGTGRLVIKRAVNTEAPNNGVVLEYGNSTNWTGQLFIGDNATQGIYYNGWSNGTRGSWRRLNEVGISLYDNTTGTTGTVTLSQTAANFNYLEIYYRKNNNYTSASAYSSVKVYSPNNKKVDLVWGAVEGSTTNQIQFAVKTISGTQITHNNAGYVNFETNAWSRSTNTNEIYIVKVLGYYN